MTTRFKKGQSGNPAGRPVGIPNPATRLRQTIANDLPEIIETLVANAKNGDTQAASLLLSRCLPPLRPQSEPEVVTVTGEGLAARADAISEAAVRGDISPTTAAELMQMLSGQARVLEVAELTERISRLETALKANERKKKS